MTAADAAGRRSPYPRILSFLRPHTPILLVAMVATALFAVLDASVYVLLIPFIDVLFVSGGGTLSMSGTGMERLLDATVYRWVDLTGDPLVAIGRIILLIVFIFLAKNVFHFVRTYLVARVEQGVNRNLRNRVYDQLVELDLSFFSRVRMGQIVSRLTTEVEQLRTLVTAELSKLLSAGFETYTHTNRRKHHENPLASVGSRLRGPDQMRQYLPQRRVWIIQMELARGPVGLHGHFGDGEI